jgi:protease-4
MREYFIWLAKILTIVIVVFFIIPILFVTVGVVGQKEQSLVAGNKKRVAVIDVTGVILDSKETLKSLYKYVEDKSVEAIVLRIDSPGGAVGPSQDIYQAVKNLKTVKPIVASMGSVAASGGLYSAIGASKVYAQPGTLTGSIGVIVQFPNLTKIAEQVGFEMVTIKSGKLKDIGNSFRNMTEEDLSYMQSTVDSIHEEFITAVAEGRGLNRSDVKEYADGRVLTGLKAKELKIVDEFGGIYDAAKSALELAGKSLSKDELPELVYPDDNLEKLKKILNATLDFPARLLGISGNTPRFQLMYLM